MKQIYKLLFSISTTGFLLIVFALALAIATFIENSYGSEAARAIVYNSWWLEVILALLVINMVANVVKFKLYKKKKITLGIFHVAFILIIIGAGITRYFGREGEMRIRQGQTTSVMMTQEPYFQFKAEYNGGEKEVSSKFLVSSISKNQINKKLSIGDKELKIKSVNYLPQAHKSIEPTAKGRAIVEVVFPVGSSMESQILESGETATINGALMGLKAPAQVEFSFKGDSLQMIAKDTISVIDMTGGQGQTFAPGVPVNCTEKTVYKVGNTPFLIKQAYPSAKIVALSGAGDQEGEGAVNIQVSDQNASEVITVWVDTQGKQPHLKGTFDGINYSTSIGPKETTLPFSLTLKKFILTRYPGSNSPSSYESQVTLEDKEQGIQKDYRIYMNNVLKHRGYRFYQSSYDMDEKGTVLSVNNDPWGTFFTYVGYFFLFLGIILSIFNPKSYFARLMKKVSAGSALLLLFIVLGFKAEAAVPTEIPGEVSADFARVWVQGHEGRIKPFSTLAYEVIMKATREERISGESPEQVVLGMAARPNEWQQVPMIAVSESEIQDKLGIKGSKAAFSDFFDAQGRYKLAEDVQTAYAKNPAQRNKSDNGVIKVDERLNVIYQLFNGELFRFYPSPDKNDGTWYSPVSKLPASFGTDSIFVRSSYKKLLEALNSSNTVEAKSVIASIKSYQQKYGSSLIPGKSKGNLEVVYNHVNIFKVLTFWYIVVGFILLIFFFNSVFTGKPLNKSAVKITVAALSIGFIFHCLGLIIRGYISEHMPWSNGYESMIYIAWAGMLAGLIFARRNPMVLGAAALLSGLTLFVAQMSWLNPEITNLVPVLKSYWLTIHVAIITASYGFLGVSAIIGILNLLLAGFQNQKNSKRVSSTVLRMSAVNQASLILGLYFLTIGTFIGGIWANESWGRYWGWDPKETWSLITILVYTFITHMRWIPGFRGWFAVNFGSVIGSISVLMTYLGVNYYLSGLHSYGSGEGLQFPLALVIVFALVGILAYLAKKNGKIVDQELIVSEEEERK